jgi:hypothetical protein
MSKVGSQTVRATLEDVRSRQRIAIRELRKTIRAWGAGSADRAEQMNGMLILADQITDDTDGSAALDVISAFEELFWRYLATSAEGLEVLLATMRVTNHTRVIDKLQSRIAARA